MTMGLPAWFRMNGGMAYEPAPELLHKKIHLSFLDRTLKAMAGLLQEFIFSESYAQKRGMLQGLDARFKLVGVLLLVVSASLLHSIPLLYGLYGLTLLLALLSRIEAAFFIKRVWLVLPFFVGVIALPATLNIFTPGEAVWKICSIGKAYHFGPYSIPAEIALTAQGVSAALLLTGRVATSMSFVLILTLTTPWADLLKALRSVRVPQIYVQTLGMALRYLLLLSQIVQETHIAKKSRTIRPQKTRAEQRWIAGQVGTLFKRSMQLSVEVHRAMVARGYQGEVRILSIFQIHKKDYLWLAFCTGLAGLLIYCGR
jgi:cobalt/nickel transport system permease protein